LPASKLNYCSINQALTAEGCIITNASITRSIVGVRTVIETGASLDGVICMGADFYESPEDRAANSAAGRPDVGIAQGTIIKGAIIDKNARIGENCRIGIDSQSRPDGDFSIYHVVDGIIIIPKNGIIPSGTVI
jgi:glucose-1-phosphate adenylyltransferase